MTCSADGCDRPRRGHGLWCNKHRQRVRRRGDPYYERWPSAVRRFFSRVVIDVRTGCWLWTGSGAGRGYEYGQFWHAGANGLAHRFAFELFRGPVPAELELDHECRVKKCANPFHLEAVTAAENMRRMRAAAQGA